MQLSGLVFAGIFFGVLLGFLIHIATAPIGPDAVSDHIVIGFEKHVYAYCEKACSVNITGNSNVVEVILAYGDVGIVINGSRNIVSIPQGTDYTLSEDGAGNFIDVRRGAFDARLQQ